ncbi:hypothetical protein FQA39_LY17777 [Lamprigera yunnana]|nr:hypothetical protein FQA39_LY17777 [Lamprigera yunnana]
MWCNIAYLDYTWSHEAGTLVKRKRRNTISPSDQNWKKEITANSYRKTIDKVQKGTRNLGKLIGENNNTKREIKESSNKLRSLATVIETAEMQDLLQSLGRKKNSIIDNLTEEIQEMNKKEEKLTRDFWKLMDRERKDGRQPHGAVKAKKGKDIELLAYADDLAAMIKDKKEESLKEKAEHTLKKVIAFLKALNLEIAKVASQMKSRMLILIMLLILNLWISEAAPLVEKSRQFIPPLPGYIPVYIRPGNTPLEDINLDLAEAFRSYALKQARLNTFRSLSDQVIVVNVRNENDLTSDLNGINFEEDDTNVITETQRTIQHIQKIPRN